MKKIKVTIGGGSKGKLVYWAYRVNGDKFDRDDCGFKFLPRRDKLRVMYYLYGLRSALTEILEKKIRAGGGKTQYLVKCYYVDDAVFRILSKWGVGFRDPLISEAVNSIKYLANNVGLLDLVRLEEKGVEKELKNTAAKYFYSRIKEILENSYMWEFSDKTRYLAYRVPEDSKDVPLDFLAGFIFGKEIRGEGISGIVVFRKDGNVTKVLFYDVKGRKRIVNAFRDLDWFFVDEWLGTFKTTYVTGSSINEVEDMLLEVAENV